MRERGRRRGLRPPRPGAAGEVEHLARAIEQQVVVVREVVQLLLQPLLQVVLLSADNGQ